MKSSNYGQDPKKLQENEHQQKFDVMDLISPDVSTSSFTKALSESLLVAALKPDG